MCVCVCHCECVRLVRARSRSGMATLMSRCHWGVVTCGGGVRTLWATPGAFSSDHNSSPRVTMATRSSSSEHQATDPPLVTVLSLERNRDTLKWIETHNGITLHDTWKKKKKRQFKKLCTALSHLGMRSCDRDASLARALIRVVMTLGAAQTAPGAGADEVISNSTASSASKQEVMRLTEQRESHDTDRYSPSTHTWKGNKSRVILCQALAHFTAECDISQYFNAWGKNAEIGENETLWVLYRIQNTRKVMHDPALCRHSFITTCV